MAEVTSAGIVICSALTGIPMRLIPAATWPAEIGYAPAATAGNAVIAIIVENRIEFVSFMRGFLY